jgi:site-specific recombinase XerD
VTTLTPETIAKYRSSLLDAGLAESTARSYESDLRMFLEWVAQEQGIPPRAVMLPIEELDSMSRKWLTVQRKVASPRTTRRRITSLRSLAIWAECQPVLVNYKSPTPAPSTPHPIPGLLSSLLLLLEISKNCHEEALIGLCGLAGLRVHEARQVRPSHLDLQTMILTVYGKGEKIRYVPVSVRCWSAIMSAFVQAFEDDGLLCPFSDRTTRDIVTRLGKAANLKRQIASHDLRATFATIIQSETQDIRVVQELLGHASVTTTQIYTEVAMEAMKKAVEF